MFKSKFTNYISVLYNFFFYSFLLDHYEGYYLSLNNGLWELIKLLWD